MPTTAVGEIATIWTEGDAARSPVRDPSAADVLSDLRSKKPANIVATLSYRPRIVHDKLHYKKQDALDTLDTTHERGRERTS